jgi:hypothetical protein
MKSYTLASVSQPVAHKKRGATEPKQILTELKPMQSKFYRGLLTLTFLAFTLPAFAQRAQSAASPLEGTWQVSVTLLNCQTGDPLGPPPFPSILTFSRGGTLAEDTTNPGFAPGQRGPGQGIWRTTEHDVFYAKSVAFINFTTPPAGPNPGFNAGQQIIKQTITYDEASDTWSAVAAVSFTDTNHNVYRTGCSMATATRF